MAGPPRPLTKLGVRLRHDGAGMELCEIATVGHVIIDSILTIYLIRLCIWLPILSLDVETYREAVQSPSITARLYEMIYTFASAMANRAVYRIHDICIGRGTGIREFACRAEPPPPPTRIVLAVQNRRCYALEYRLYRELTPFRDISSISHYLIGS